MELSSLTYQWIIIIAAGIGLYLISPVANSISGFFKGESDDSTQPGFLMLTSSLVITWIFAKSITNAANLGESFGIVGGVAYATYYLSFLVAGVIIYKMRKVGKFGSIHTFLRSKYGKTAVMIFSLVIAFRLFNEVWSNTLVIGSYFGERGSAPFLISMGVFTLLTLAYSIKGGFRSSLITDMIQMALFSVLLFVILAVIIPEKGSIKPFLTSGTWSMSTGLNLCFAALIQIFSYPFHDPVMTDRAFISDEKTTLKSFFLASVVGFFCILLFSFVGIYAQDLGLEGSDAPVKVSQSLGAGMMLLVNVIMITSAGSTLDSTFTSVSKLSVVDMFPERLQKVSTGRWVMVGTAVLGSIPLIVSPDIISATTVSGTMVIGLAPVFVFWKMEAPKISYFLSMGFGIASGIILTMGILPESWYLSSGAYADLFAINVYGTILCFAGFLIPTFFINKETSE